MPNKVLLLRSGAFLTRERMTLWSTWLLVGFVIGGLFLGLSARGANDYAGRPLGTDFSNVYAAGVQALRGHPTAPFDILRQQQAEQAIFGPRTQLYGWHYPPFFLLVAAGLACLPYLAALFLWQAATLLLYLGAIALLLRKSAAVYLFHDRLWLLLALGFPAVFVNFLHGQNGFLTAALFACGLALLQERPVLAGLVLGLLCYKPQFGAVIPLVLALTGRWRAMAGIAATVVSAAIATTLLFGHDVWPAFLASARFTRLVVLEQGNTGFYKMQSVFAWIRMWGGDVGLAYCGQAIASLLVLFALIRIWRADTAMAYKGAALCLSALLITPYSLDYDLMLLAPAVALLAAQGMVQGFKAYEQLCLAMLWFVPAIARTMAHYAFLPLAVPAMCFCLALIYRRSIQVSDAMADRSGSKTNWRGVGACSQSQKQTAW